MASFRVWQRSADKALALIAVMAVSGCGTFMVET